ncbi:hypothetical protein Prudu_021387 [Prunus dulcis]|uniref:Ankyrin repeat family protein n=1 Tax=Prunus dulcis TaxID=3755 RepID=A0A4Y1RYE5_PRUDU|nr:hypothetical protein Prudu_021387 [Prunus dulcis]
MVGIKTLGFGGFGNFKSGHFRPFFGEPWPLVFRIFRRMLSLWSHFCSRIRRGRSMTTAPSSDPPAQSASTATAPALMEHVLVGLGASQVPASFASSIAQPASARRRHRPADTTETTLTDGTGASGSQPAKKNTRGPCRQLKTAKVTRVINSRISIGYDERHRAAPTVELHSSLAHDIGHTNYNLEDLDEESLAYVNRLFDERYKQWKSDLHHHFQAFDDPQVALQEGCPKELEGREDSWEWLCAHFQAPEYMNKAQVNKGNRKKKTLLHHSGSRPFSYRMDARRREGPSSQRSMSLVTFMSDPGMSWPNDDGGEEPVGSSGVRLQLPPETPIESVAPPQDAGFQILTETLDQTLGRRPGTYCRGMGNARRREPRLVHRRSQTVSPSHRAAFRSPVLCVDLPARPPRHAHQTTAPVDAQTSEPHTGDDPVDFASLFD